MPTSTTISSSGRLVVIAASAGGLPAILEVLAPLPPDLPAAIAIVQHTAVEGHHRLVEILARHTRLRVQYAEEGAILHPGTVYVCPPGMHMTSEHALRLTAGPKINFVQPNADLMFESVSHTYGDRAIGVVLSGAGSDAAMGSLAIAHAGGTVLAQDDRTCAFPQMPNAANRVGSVHQVMTPTEIALEIERLVYGRRHRAMRPGSDPSAPPRVKVVLADDHKIVLDGLAVLIDGEPDMEVVSATDDGASVVRIAAELEPDVVVMDIRMPPPDGIEATRQIVMHSSETRVVALSAENDPRSIDAVLRAGACGYVSKQRAFGELVNAIRSALDGKVYLSSDVAQLVIAGAVAPPTARPRRRL